MSHRLALALLIAGCAVDDDLDEISTELTAPGWCEQTIPMIGFPPALNVEEPFVRVTPAGTMLYFSDRAPNELRDLHQARWTALGFQYLGLLNGANTPGFIEGAPSVDVDGNLYFTNSAVPQMISRGVLYNGLLVGAAPLAGTPPSASSGTLFTGNMDIGVAPAHKFAVLSRAVWNGTPFPIWADLWYLERAQPDAVMHNPLATQVLLGALNSNELEYAPEISADGLAIVFNRTSLDGATSRIMLSTRASVTSPFGPPVALATSAPGMLIEGPTFVPPNRIMFHKRNLMAPQLPVRLSSVAPCP